MINRTQCRMRRSWHGKLSRASPVPCYAPIPAPMRLRMPDSLPPDSLRLGRRTFAAGELAVMAIVNRTPDSFFDKGATFAAEAALAAVDRAVAEGADIIDIGGVKAGPGDPVDAAEELRRTIP